MESQNREFEGCFPERAEKIIKGISKFKYLMSQNGSKSKTKTV